jgi:hypothetical protein
MRTGIILAGENIRFDKKVIPLLLFENEKIIYRQINEMKKIMSGSHNCDK